MLRYRDSLPPPLAENWDWQLRAACRDLDLNKFFHPPGERSRRRERRIREAKQVCAGCPVAQQCLQHALGVQEPYGIWGGLSEEERAAALGLKSMSSSARKQKVAWGASRASSGATTRRMDSAG